MIGPTRIAQTVARGVLYAVLVAFAGASAAAGGEASQGAPPAGSDWVAKTTQTCTSCHGKKGVSQSPMFPVLAGQYQNYLLHALTAYRDGGRKNAIMSGQVRGMSDDQLKALARYYSQQQSSLHTPYMD